MAHYRLAVMLAKQTPVRALKSDRLRIASKLEQRRKIDNMALGRESEMFFGL